MLMSNYSEELPEELPLFYEAGFKAGIWNFFEVYFPLIVSENMKSQAGTQKERIRFVFKLDIFKPL
jgi:hypothetical protein